MFSQIIATSFSDTDALGHINNARVPVWFEAARDPIFRFFMPTLDLTRWHLILAKIDVTFHAEMFYGRPVEVRSYISRLGSSSFDVYQELWQDEMKKASGTAVMVHFNHVSKKSEPLPENNREQLSAHFIEL